MLSFIRKWVDYDFEIYRTRENINLKNVEKERVDILIQFIIKTTCSGCLNKWSGSIVFLDILQTKYRINIVIYLLSTGAAGVVVGQPFDTVKVSQILCWNNVIGKIVEQSETECLNLHPREILAHMFYVFCDNKYC